MSPKVIVVTGGNSGIGFEICKRFASDGWRVALAGRRPDACEKAAKDLSSLGEVKPFIADVADSAAVNTMISNVMDAFGRIDMLVCNAGVGLNKGLKETTNEDWKNVFSSSVDGTFYCLRAAYPVFKDQKSGHVVIIASQAAGWHGWNEFAYGTAKTAQVKMCTHLKDQFARLSEEQNIKPGQSRYFVHAVCPGAVVTPLWEKIGRELKPWMKVLQPTDIPDLVAELAEHPEYGLPEIKSLMKPYDVSSMKNYFEHEPDVIRIAREE